MTSTSPTSSRLAQLNVLRRRLGPAGPVALLGAVGPTVGLLLLTSALSTTNLLTAMAAHRTIAAAGYLLIAWTVGVFLLPTYASAVVAGYVFGFQLGLILALLGYLGASCGTFAVGRALARDRVAPLIDEHPRLIAVRRALAGRSTVQALVLVILLRLSPATPFALTNLTFAAAGLRWRAFALGTALGVLPRTFAVVGFAAHMDQLRFDADGGWWLFAAGVVATLIAVLIIGRLVRRELDRQLREPAGVVLSDR